MLYYLDCFHRKRDISGIVMIVRVILRKNKCSIHHNLVINGKIFLSKSEILSNLSKDNKYSIEEVAFNLVKCDKMQIYTHKEIRLNLLKVIFMVLRVMENNLLKRINLLSCFVSI